MTYRQIQNVLEDMTEDQLEQQAVVYNEAKDEFLQVDQISLFEDDEDETDENRQWNKDHPVIWITAVDNNEDFE